jgi:uncharacterized metal-binding protein YceD (DUF177 family)
MNGPEFSRLVPIESIGPTQRAITVEANEAERTGLARRMGIPSVLALSCSFDLRRESTAAGVILGRGHLVARVVQTCVLTLDEFEADLTEAFDLRFVPAGMESEDMDLEGPDEVPYEAGQLDLGEAAAEQLALALDPFPRKPGASLPVEEEPRPSPFDVLGSLRRH